MIEKDMFPASMRAEDVAWFLERVSRCPHLAQAPVSVKPEHVAGDHVSARVRTGWRVWGFATERERDTFLATGAGRKFP